MDKSELSNESGNKPAQSTIRQRQKRGRDRVTKNWENNGFHQMDPPPIVLHETAEGLYDLVEEMGLESPEEAVDLLVHTCRQNADFKKAVKISSTSAVTRDNQNRRDEIHLLNQEANSRLLPYVAE